jgi:hypothetical protein
MDLKTLAFRYRLRKSQKSAFEQSLNEIDYFISPLHSRNDANATEGSEEWKNQNVWDFTAPDASARLSASIAQSVASPVVHFAKPSWRVKELRDSFEAMQYAQQVEEIAFDAFEDSDFYTEFESAMQEFVDHANCFIIREAVYDADGSFMGFDFTSVPVGEGYFDPDRRGEIKNFWRRLNWKPSQIIDLCQSKGWKVPEEIQKKYDSGEDNSVELVYCIFEREEILSKNRRKKENPSPVAPTLRPYGSIYFLNEGDVQVGEEEGYYRMPVSFAKWKPKSGSIWGYGLGHQALPSVKYLNGWREMVRTQGEIALDPPTVSNDRGVLSELQKQAGGHTYVRDVDQIKPLVSGQRFDVAIEMTRDDREQIRMLYHYDDLHLKDTPQMTALEVQARIDQMNRLLGSTYTRIQSGLLKKIFLDTVFDLDRAGRLPPMPDIVRQNGGLMALEFQGPLARAQRSDEVAAVERFTAQTAGLSQYFPEALAIINAEKVLRNVAQKLGIPNELLNSPSKVKEIVAQQKAMQQQQMQADANRKNMAAMKDAAAAQQMAGQQGGAGIPFPGTVPLGPGGQPA